MPPQNVPGLAGEKPSSNSNKQLNSKFNVVATKMEPTPEKTTVVVPPDGGWGWMIVIGSFLNNVVVDGIVFSAGMFQDPIRDEFNASKAQVALVSSLLSGFYLIAGPFVSALANKWGFRMVTIMGAFVASAAFTLSYFAESVIHLYITYGVLGGIGFCMIYVPSVITVGYYFEKWRALATGISLCGSGVGTFIFAPLSSYLIETAGWKGALLIQAGIILSCAVFGSLFRPLEPVEITAEIDDQKDKELVPMNQFTKPADDERVHNTWIGVFHNNNHHYPTADEVFRRSNVALERRLSNVSNSSSGQPSKMEQLQLNKTKVTTVPSGTEEPLTVVGEAEEENDALLDEELKPVIMTQRRHTLTERRPSGTTTKRRAHHHLPEAHRPMYRDDIFFSGSLNRVPQYISTTSLHYHMSVTRLPTKEEVEEEQERSCKLCPAAVKRTLSTMLDMSLLKSPSFMLLAVSGFLTMMGFFVPFMFITPRAIKGGMDEGVSLFIVSAIGIANTFARIGCGLLSSFKGINALHLNNVAITIGGIATIFSGHLITEAYQFTYAGIFGIAIACFSALRSILAVDLMGLEKLTNAFGILMLFQGLAAVLGAPIAGMFFDLTQTYDASFWLAGSLITLSAVICYPLNMVNRWEKKRAAEKLRLATV